MQCFLRQGSAILFYSQLPDGNIDELALHGGMPVAQGARLHNMRKLF